MYRFDKKAERFEWMGAAHAYEVPYAFNNVSANDYLGDIDPKLALDMSTAWANFARTGDPSIDKASWETYDPQTRDTMIFGEDGSMTMEQDPWKEQRELTAFANKFDKKFSMFVFEGITIVGFFVFYFIGITGFLSAFLFAVCTGFATTVFYGVMYSLIYDCCDIHELATGERTEGSIMAISSLAQTVASAVGGLIFGMLLTFIGYDTANITPEVIHGILTLVTIVPAIAMIASLLILCLYKVNPKRFQDVQEALKDRREGKEIDLNEFKDII